MMKPDYIMNTYAQQPVTFVKGEGNYLIDEQGNKYLDFVGGIAVNALGYSHKGLKEALHQQVDELLHCSNLYYNDEQLKAGKKLVDLLTLDEAFFCNSGAEAVEGSMKLARKYAKKQGYEERYEIITMTNSFHGRTLGAITATGQTKYQKGLNPLLPGIVHVPYNDEVALKEAINDKTCAIMTEVIQGEGGIVSAHKAFLETARALCDEKDMLLIYDEVQTGMGRTGYPMAFMHYGIKPDVVALAKGLGSGVPVGAVVATHEAASGFSPGDHASTFGGNPLAMAAVNVVVDSLSDKAFMSKVQETAGYLDVQLKQLMADKEAITEVRGLGLMRGLAIDKPLRPILDACFEKGLLIVGAGSNVLRFVPPLVITKEEIDRCIAILREVI